MTHQQLTELHHDLILTFDLKSDMNCELITQVFQTILDFNDIYSNGRCEEEGSELVDILVEFFNRVSPPEEHAFQTLMNDYVESLYPHYLTEKEYIQGQETI